MPNAVSPYSLLPKILTLIRTALNAVCIGTHTNNSAAGLSILMYFSCLFSLVFSSANDFPFVLIDVTPSLLLLYRTNFHQTAVHNYYKIFFQLYLQSLHLKLTAVQGYLLVLPMPSVAVNAIPASESRNPIHFTADFQPCLYILCFSRLFV